MSLFNQNLLRFLVIIVAITLCQSAWADTDAGYNLFDEGREGALIGQAGWLFTNKELINSKKIAQNIEDNNSYILSVRDKLLEKNIKLLIVPIPSKVRIYSDKLEHYKSSRYWKNQYQNFLNFLSQNDIAFIDLQSIFQKNKSKNIYLKTDTHWSPLGARVASLSIESMISTSWPYLNWQMNEHESVKGKLIEYEGNLMKYANNSEVPKISGLQKDQFYQWTTTPIEKEGNDLFGEFDSPVTLVGTSYSANKLWHFEGFLKQILGTNVLNVSDSRLGPFEVMETYLESNFYKEFSPKIVIWEIPERYLNIKYKAENAKKIAR